jgi:hypothetical protein
MKKIRILVLVFLIIGGVLYYFTYIVSEALKKGETHKDLERIIANELKDSIKVRLVSHYNLSGTYPIMNSKYFLDSIGNIDFVDKVYLYSDSIGKFIGVGSSNQYLEYKCTDGHNYTIELIYK